MMEILLYHLVSSGINNLIPKLLQWHSYWSRAPVLCTNELYLGPRYNCCQHQKVYNRLTNLEIMQIHVQNHSATTLIRSIFEYSVGPIKRVTILHAPLQCLQRLLTDSLVSSHNILDPLDILVQCWPHQKSVSPDQHTDGLKNNRQELNKIHTSGH